MRTKNKKLIPLPRGYLSYSQWDLWKRDRKRYIDNYILGDRREINNSGLQFGKVFAEAANRGFDADPVIDLLLRSVSGFGKEGVSEYSLKPVLFDEVPLLGQIDRFLPASLRFEEYKTGRVPWTQAKAQKHGQMRFYSTMIWCEHKAFSEYNDLIWIPTEEVPVYNEIGSIVRFEVRPTGEIKPFTVYTPLAEILDMAGDIRKVAHEISEVFLSEVNRSF